MTLNTITMRKMTNGKWKMENTEKIKKKKPIPE